MTHSEQEDEIINGRGISELLTGTSSKPMCTSSALIFTALSSISRTKFLTSTESESAWRTRTSNKSKEFHVCPCTLAASVLMVGLAAATSSTVTILRPGRDTKLKVSGGRESKASRRRSWYNELDHGLQNPVTACGSASRGLLSRIAIKSLSVAVSTPCRSGRSNVSMMLAQSTLPFCPAN